MADYIDCTAAVALCFLTIFFTEQSNAEKKRLDRERSLSDPIASVGESWDRDTVSCLGAFA